MEELSSDQFYLEHENQPCRSNSGNAKNIHENVSGKGGEVLFQSFIAPTGGKPTMRAQQLFVPFGLPKLKNASLIITGTICHLLLI